jgi:hypothetical protein
LWLALRSESNRRHHADPLAFRMEAGRRFRSPVAWELELLEACL